MDNKNDYVLILGSKPGSPMPNIEVTDVYAANGAAERAKTYKTFFPSANIISVIGAREFEKNIEVQKRVLDASPDIVVSRSGKLDLEKYNFKRETKFITFSNFEQLMIQSNFFNFHILDIILKETYYESKFFKKIVHLIKSMKSGRLTGASTGFFSILYALKINPQKKVIISGIGMTGGGHYYNENSNRYSNRSLVDRKLILNLKSFFKSRLCTTDQELSKIAGIEFWRKDLIN